MAITIVSPLFVLDADTPCGSSLFLSAVASASGGPCRTMAPYLCRPLSCLTATLARVETWRIGWGWVPATRGVCPPNCNPCVGGNLAHRAFLLGSGQGRAGESCQVAAAYEEPSFFKEDHPLMGTGGVPVELFACCLAFVARHHA